MCKTNDFLLMKYCRNIITVYQIVDILFPLTSLGWLCWVWKKLDYFFFFVRAEKKLRELRGRNYYIWMRINQYRLIDWVGWLPMFNWQLSSVLQDSIICCVSKYFAPHLIYLNRVISFLVRKSVIALTVTDVCILLLLARNIQLLAKALLHI